jgi:hypothetical protein
MSDEFRAAGEFYGHMLAALACGDLIMRHEGQGFVYQWNLKIHNRPVSAEHRVTSIELIHARFLHDRAKGVAARWQREIKELQG